MEVLESMTMISSTPAKKAKLGRRARANAWQSFKGQKSGEPKAVDLEIRLTGKLDLERLERSLQQWHRTYDAQGPQPREMIVLDEIKGESLRRMDGSQSGPQAELDNQLTNPVLWRITEKEYGLKWRAPYSAISSALVYGLVREVARCYEESELCSGFEDSVEDHWTTGYEEGMEVLVSYWRELMESSNALELSVDQKHERESVDNKGQKAVWLSLSGETLEALRKEAAQHKLESDDIWTAAAALLLHRYSGQEGLLLGITEGVYGTTLVRSDLQEAGTLAQAALELKERRSLGRTRQKERVEWLRSAELRELLQEGGKLHPAVRLVPDRTYRKTAQPVTVGAGSKAGEEQAGWLDRSSAHDTRACEEAFEAGGLRWELKETANMETEPPLEFSFIQEGQLLASYDPLTVSDGQAEAMLHHLAALLDRFAAEPEAPISTLLAAIPPQKLRVAIASSFTSGLLEDSLAFWLDQLGVPYQLRFAPYNQVFQQLLDPTSLISDNNEGVNVILLRLEDVCQPDEEDSGRSLEEYAGNIAKEWLQALEGYRDASSAPCLLVLCPPSEAAVDERRAALFCAVTAFLAEGCARLDGIVLSNHEEISAIYPTQTVNDRYADELGHVPYTAEYFAALGTWTARKLLLWLRQPYMLTVVEADGVLWNGSSGEEDGATITEGNRAIQQFLVDLRHTGVEIGVCGVQLRDDAVRVFRENRDMPFGLKHVNNWRFGAEPVSKLVAEIANEQGVVPEEILYIGANGAFCEEVRTALPGIEVVRLPEGPLGRLEMEQFLKHTWVLDWLGF